MKMIEFSPFPDYPGRLPLTAHPLDEWSFEVDKSVLQGNAVGTVEVVIYAPYNQSNCNDPKAPLVYPAAGGVRLFDEDGQVKFQLSAGKLEAGKQFALFVAGADFFGTFVVGGGGQEVELTRIAEWLEDKTENSVRVNRSGSLLTVTMRPAFAGQFNGKDLTVGLGTPSKPNTNNPAIQLQAQGNSFSEGAMDGYSWQFSNLMAGQIIRFGAFVSYTVQPNDTSESLSAFFLTRFGYSKFKDGLFWIPAGQTWTITGEAGSRKVANTNKVQFSANYVKTQDNVDYYTFAIVGDVQEGNIFRYTRQDGTLFEHIVPAGQTTAQSEAACNAAGQVGAKRGSSPNAKFTPGSRTQANPSAPVVLQTLVRSRPATLYQKYWATVAVDVVPGNTFAITTTDVQPGTRTKLIDAKYSAVLADNAETVAKALVANIPGGSLLEPTKIEFYAPSLSIVEVTALRGTPMTDADTAPVYVVGSSVLVETMKKTVLGWCRFPCKKDVYMIGLRKTGQANPFALSNPVISKSNYGGRTMMIASGNWRFRLSGTVRTLTPSRDQTSGTTSSGTTRSSSTLSFKKDLYLAPQQDWFHMALNELMNSSFFVDGSTYSADGDYALSAEQPGGYGRSGRQTMVLASDSAKCASVERATITIPANPFGIRVRLAGEEKSYQMTASGTALRGAYYLEVYSGSPFPTIVRVFEDGAETYKTYLAGFGHTDARVLLLRPGKQVRVTAEPIPVASCAFVGKATVASWTCEIRTTKTLSEYSDEYSGEYADKGKNIQIPEVSFGGSNTALTGWKVPATVTIQGGSTVTYQVYLDTYVPQGYPFLGPVFDPVTCG